MYDDQTGESLAVDPYNLSEKDLKHCRAADSSLWELATISKAAPEKLFKAALFIKKTIPPEETDISPYLEVEYDEVNKQTCQICKVH